VLAERDGLLDVCTPSRAGTTYIHMGSFSPCVISTQRRSGSGTCHCRAAALAIDVSQVVKCVALVQK
jgi:hypothetical protein